MSVLGNSKNRQVSNSANWQMEFSAKIRQLFRQIKIPQVGFSANGRNAGEFLADSTHIDGPDHSARAAVHSRRSSNFGEKKHDDMSKFNPSLFD
jgi:hypothetical protein